MKQLTRREFNASMGRIGLGLASASLFPSFAIPAAWAYPEGKFVDAHHHMWKVMSPDHPDISLETILAWMDQHQVSQTVILSAIEHPVEYFSGRGWPDIVEDELLEQFRDTRGRLIPFCTFHYDAYDSHQEIYKELKRFQAKGVIGFGELKPRDRDWKPGNVPVDDPRMKRIYRACAEIGFPVLLHIDDRHAVDQPGLPRLEKVLKAYPDVNFIGHANGWWNCITGDADSLGGYPKGKVTPGGAAPRLLETYPNMYADLSANSGMNAITRDPEFGIGFLKEFADKLLFGTDALGGEGREAHFDFYNDADLPQEVEDKIFRDNTRKLLKL